MLIKLTNKCVMGCSHCMEKSVPSFKDHMTEETFVKALKKSIELEMLALKSGYPRITLLSGGECTEHPQFEEFASFAAKTGAIVMGLSHGLWLKDKERAERLLALPVLWQITNDPRFYPTKVDEVVHPNVTFIPSLTHLLPLGRFSKKEHPELPTKRAPTSFNFRSVVKATRDIAEGVAILRMHPGAVGLGTQCSPSISCDGSIVAGESNMCWKIGTVDSTNEELTKAVIEMGSCNRCGLEEGLDQREKRAIGLSTLYLGTE